MHSFVVDQAGQLVMTVEGFKDALMTSKPETVFPPQGWPVPKYLLSMGTGQITTSVNRQADTNI